MNMQVISRYLKLFKADDNRESAHLVITAHGCIEKGAAQTVNHPGIRLHFYSKHGTTTTDKNLISFKTNEFNNQQRVETLEVGNPSYDYLLSKYQGARAGPNSNVIMETYETINACLNRVPVIYTDLEKEFAKQHGFPPQAPLSPGSFDVLSIRSRLALTIPFGPTFDIQDCFTEIRLSYVLDELKKQNIHYGDIHCYFCRSEVS